MHDRSPLSSRDAQVLSVLFDPEGALSACQPALKEAKSEALPDFEDITFEELQKIEKAAIAPLHSDSPPEAAVQDAVAALSAIIKAHPTYPSAYVNRAQASRMLRHKFCKSNLIFDDLTRAIALAAPKDRNETVSAHRAQVLAAAHSHRGFLLLGAAADVSGCIGSNEEALENVPESLKSMDQESISELASRDFAEGGRYGDELAQLMAVRTNPYAKMCGAIVKGALREEIGQWAGKSAMPCVTQI